MSWKDALLGGGALGIAFDATLNSFDVILSGVDILLGSSDVLFTIFVVLNGSVAPNLDWLSEDLMRNLLLLAALLYLVHLSMKLKRRLENEST